MLAKFTKPTMDEAPYGTVWNFIHSDKSHEYWIQMSKTDSMDWQRLGHVMERSFEFHINNDTDSFIADILHLIDLKIEKVKEPEA
jgi:hypothetical protein